MCYTLALLLRLHHIRLKTTNFIHNYSIKLAIGIHSPRITLYLIGFISSQQNHQCPIVLKSHVIFSWPQCSLTVNRPVAQKQRKNKQVRHSEQAITAAIL